MPTYRVKVYLLDNGKVTKRTVKINASNREEAERRVLFLFKLTAVKAKAI